LCCTAYSTFLITSNNYCLLLDQCLPTRLDILNYFGTYYIANVPNLSNLANDVVLKYSEEQATFDVVVVVVVVVVVFLISANVLKLSSKYIKYSDFIMLIIMLSNANNNNNNNNNNE
jgi:hypothetical protein